MDILQPGTPITEPVEIFCGLTVFPYQKGYSGKDTAYIAFKSTHSEKDFIISLIEWSEKNEKEYDFDEQLLKYNAAISSDLWKYLKQCAKLAYLISINDFKGIVYSIGRGDISRSDMICFLLSEYPEEFNLTLRDTPQEVWAGKLYTCGGARTGKCNKVTPGRGAGYYRPYLDFRFVPVPGIIELETPKDMDFVKLPDKFDLSQVLFRFKKR